MTATPNNKANGLRKSCAASELDAIHRMLIAASQHRLWAEVVWSFGQARVGGDNVYQAVAFALKEWDL